MTAVHQFVPMLHRADAVGRHTLRLREVLEARGVRSEIYVELTDEETAALTQPFGRYAEEARAGGRPRLPVRHRIGHRLLSQDAS